MTLQDLVSCFTKYYAIVIANDNTRYEDQTVMPKYRLCQNVLNADFYEDCGEGETLLVYLKEKK